MQNNQLPEKIIKSYKWGIDAVDVWETIQGEGPLVGSPSVFIRLAGCNFQCPLCDTDYTSNRTPFSVERLVELVQEKRQRGLVVITGGEPFRQPIGKLCTALIVAGYQVQVETNGTLYQEDTPWGAITIVCSPKSPVINKRLRPHINALKYVVQAGHIDEGDGLPTSVLGIECKVARPEGMIYSDIYVQPADEGDEKKNLDNLQAALRSCLRFGYRLCLQQHKIIGLP